MLCKLVSSTKVLESPGPNDRLKATCRQIPPQIQKPPSCPELNGRALDENLRRKSPRHAKSLHDRDTRVEARVFELRLFGWGRALQVDHKL